MVSGAEAGIPVGKGESDETCIFFIECFHPSANQEQRKILVEYAKNNNLYISGGSDYHGSPKPDIEIGVGREDLSISKEILNWLYE